MSLLRAPIVRLIALAVGIAPLVACDSDVTINLQEIATCRNFPGHGGSAPGFESWVFYKLVSIENQRPQAMDFNFGSGRLIYHVGPPAVPEVDIPASIPPQGVTSAPSAIVTKGTTLTAQGGKFAIGLQGAERQSHLLDATHPLTYQNDQWFQNVKVVALPFTRSDMDTCTAGQIGAL